MLDDIRPPKTEKSPNNDYLDNQSMLQAPRGTNELLGSTAIESANNNEQRRGFLFIKNLPKRTKIIILAAVLLLAIGSGISAYALTRPEKVIEPVVVQPPLKPPEPPKPVIEPSKLTGLPVALEVNKRAVLGVMIENSPDARPQSGLKEAGIIFEAIAEGGITRFLTLFQDTEAGKIGPIRSVRPYYIDWFAPYQAAIAHAGGSSQALAEIKAESHRDIDQFANSGYYQRSSSRFAPHNLYSSTPRLVELMNAKGFVTSEFTGILRKEKEEPSTTVTARTIDLRISSALYNVHYDYDAASNSYLRSLGGRPHTDEPSGTQLAPKVVVALIIPHRYNGIYSVYGTSGSGTAFIFQDGTFAQVLWEKPSRSSQYSFKLADGTPVKLSPGQTWFSVIADASRIQYAP